MTMSREQVLDELERVASLEHAVCLECLTFHAALGHDTSNASGPSATRIREAADAAFRTALGEMAHLRRVNQALTAAGRGPQLGRAASVQKTSAPAIALIPAGGANLADFLDRNRLIADAVDDAYARLRSSVTAPDSPFGDDAPEALLLALDPGPDHTEAASELATLLRDIPAAEYLRATRRQPNNAVESSLLHLADVHYNLILAILQTWFEHPELEGELRGRALSAMDATHAINGLLVARGVLPAFALDADLAGGPGSS